MSSSYTRSSPPDDRVSSVAPGETAGAVQPAEGPDACAGPSVVSAGVVDAVTGVVVEAASCSPSSPPEQAASAASAASATATRATRRRVGCTSGLRREADHADLARTREEGEAVA